MTNSDPSKRDASKDSLHSLFREKLIEHFLVGELLKHSWSRGDCALEISRPEVDRAGYDLVAEHGDVLRHIQLKASRQGAATGKLNIHLDLAKKPSACVVWVVFDEDSLALTEFRFFGEEPGQRLACLCDHEVAKHTKANADGVKTERPNLRVLRKKHFRELSGVKELWSALFGAEQPVEEPDSSTCPKCGGEDRAPAMTSVSTEESH